MKKVLITGASGFVGSFLVEAFLGADPELEVYAGVRKTSSRQFLTDPRIQFFEMDFSNQKKLEKDLGEKGFNYVIHNAGLTKADRKKDYFLVNCDYTENLINALQTLPVPVEKFVYMSSMAAYGPADNMPEDLVKETDTPRPIDTYGESKLAAERVIKKYKNLPYLIFRPTAVYGPRERDIYTFFTILNKGLEPYIGMAEQSLTFIYVKDLVALIAKATLSEHRQKCYFVADGSVYSNYDLGKYGKKYLNKKAIKIKVPTGLVRGIAYLNESIGKIIGKMPALNLEKVNILESLNWKCDIRALKTDFDFIPKYNLATGLQETIEWYRKEGWL